MIDQRKSENRFCKILEVHQNVLVALVLLVLLAGVGTQGCRLQGPYPEFYGLSGTLKSGQQDFLKANYQLAREKFNLVIQRKSDPKLMTSARYGLVCVEMITAHDLEAFFKALKGMKQYHAPGQIVDHENPELFIRAIFHGASLMEKYDIKRIATMSRLKTKEKKQNMEILKMQERIKILQHQISALESIDQEEQEKRKNQ